MKIAIIDGELNKEDRKKVSQDFISIGINKNVENHLESDVTHASLCMKVLEKYSTNYTLLHINVAEKSGKGICVKNVKRALEICYETRIDILSLSIGTTKMSDSAELYPPIKKLAKAGCIIVAAQSNELYRTLPAYYEEVISVAADKVGIFENNGLLSLSKNVLGLDFLVTYSKDEKTNVNRSNSLSVPRLAAYINNILNDSNRQGSTWIKPHLVQHCEKLSINKYLRGVKTNTFDTVQVQIMDDNIDLHELLKELWEIHKVEAVAVSRDRSDDPRVFYMDSSKKQLNSINCANADVIFIVNKDNSIGSFDYQLKSTSNTVRMYSKEGKVYIKNIGERLTNFIVRVIS